MPVDARTLREFRSDRIRMRQVYRRVFENSDGELVLADMERFVHQNGTTHVPGDPYGSHQLEGRRQVLTMLILDAMNYEPPNEGDEQ